MKYALHARWFIPLVPLLALSAPWFAATGAEDDAQYRFTGIRRVVAIADIHGAYDAFVSLLRGTGLVDESLGWSGDDAHLVLLGDVLDRGEESRRALDLVMKLEVEARDARGAMHMLLGNHEIMNLTGELGYISDDEFEAYRDMESARDRSRAVDRFSNLPGAAGLRPIQLRSAFSRSYPRGFFGHRAAFAPDGIYGRWLLHRPVLLVINDTAFVHAGLSVRLGGESLAAINQQATADLSRYLAAMQTLIREEVIAPETDYHRQAALASRYVEDRGSRAGENVRQAAQTLELLYRNQLFAGDSAVWYRGMVACSPAIEYDRLQTVFGNLGVRRMIIGHTPTAGRRVQERFDNALLMADTGMLESFFGGRPSAVVMEEGELSVYYAGDDDLASPVPQPRVVGPRPMGVGDAALETLLAAGAISAPSPLSGSPVKVGVQGNGQDFDALFMPAPAGGSQPFIPEVAAYRLDRLLSLDMVPVAVRREVDGVTGALLMDAGEMTTEQERARDPAGTPWCPLEDQHRLMTVFDMLVHKEARADSDMRYHEQSWQLVLTGNHDILGRQPDLPPPLEETPAVVSAFLAEKLKALTPQSLEAALGDVLAEDRRGALLQRRDALLEKAGW